MGNPQAHQYNSWLQPRSVLCFFLAAGHRTSLHGHLSHLSHSKSTVNPSLIPRVTIGHPKVPFQISHLSHTKSAVNSSLIPRFTIRHPKVPFQFVSLILFPIGAPEAF